MLLMPLAPKAQESDTTMLKKEQMPATKKLNKRA